MDKRLALSAGELREKRELNWKFSSREDRVLCRHGDDNKEFKVSISFRGTRLLKELTASARKRSAEGATSGVLTEAINLNHAK